MGLVLRTSHMPMPIGATVSNHRLTVEQMDNNFIFLQNLSHSISPLTVSEAKDLMSSSEVVTGQFYLITDAAPYLYGTQSDFGFGDGTNIIVQGLDENTFYTNGWGKFYNPKYNDYDVWDYGASYSVSSIVIYGGRVWGKYTNTGNDGSNDYLNLDTDWVPLSHLDETYYNVVWDEIEHIIDAEVYGYGDPISFISSRYDARNNNLVKNNLAVLFYHCEMDPIQGFRWGHELGDNGGVANCEVINSYLGCLNFVSGSIYDIYLTGFSHIYDINLRSSSLYGIKLSNNSGLHNFSVVDGSSIYGVEIDNDSSFYNFDISGYISNVKISNNSDIHNFALEGYMNDITVENNSEINLDNELYGTFESIVVSNSSSFNSIYLDNNNSISNITVSDGSEFSNMSLYDNSYIEYVEVRLNSNFGYMNYYNDAYVENIICENESSIGYASLYDTNLDSIKVSNDSYIEFNSNLYGGYLYGIDMTNDSSIYDLSMTASSYIDTVRMDNGLIQNIEMTNSGYLETLTIETNSYIENLYLDNSYIRYVNISENSSISYLQDDYGMYNSYLTYIEISNNSAIAYTYMDNSYMEYIKLTNESYIGGLFLNRNNSTSESYLSNIDLTNNSYISDDDDTIYLDKGSYFQYVNLENNSYITGYMKLISSNLSNITLTNDSYIDAGYNTDGDYVDNRGAYNYVMELHNSNISQLTLNNNSYVGYGHISLTASSAIYNVTLDNFSYIRSWISLDDSGMGHFSLTNHSKFGKTNGYGSIELYNGSAIEYLTMDNALLDGFIYMDNSSMIQVNLNGLPNPDDGNFGNSNYSNYYDFDINSATFGEDIELYDSFLQDIQVSNGGHFGGNYDSIYLESNSFMRSIKLDNGSIFTDVYLGKSRMEYVEVTNGSYIYNIDLEGTDGSSITYLTVNNYSYFGDYIYLDNASMQFIEIDNNSQLQGSNHGDGDISLYSGSYLENIKLSNYSQITGTLSLHDTSYFTLIELSNYSQITGANNEIQLHSGSYFEAIKLDTESAITAYDTDNIYLSSSDISSIDLSNRSTFFGDVSLYDGSYMRNFNITNNSSFGGGIYLGDSGAGYITNLSIDNNSQFVGYIDNNSINLYNGSTIDSVKLSNDSAFTGYIEMGEGSYFTDISIENNSYISGDIYIYLGSTVKNINILNDSYIEGYMDIYGGYVNDINISNYSFMGNTTEQGGIKVYNNATLEYITINNYSRFNSVYLTGSNTKFYYVSLNNYSYIDPNTNFYGNSYLNLSSASEMKYIELDNHSHIKGNLLLSASYIKRLQMANYSKIDGDNHLSNSHIQYFSMLNVSDNSGQSCYGPGFNNFYLSNSYMEGIDLKWSTMAGLTIENSSTIEGLQVSNSGIFNTQLYNNSHIYSTKINDSYIDGNVNYSNGYRYGGLYLDSSSVIASVDFNDVGFPNWNDSENGIYLHNSSFTNISWNDAYTKRVVATSSNIDSLTLLSNSYLGYVNLSDSNIYASELKISSLDTISLNNATWFGLFLKQSTIYDYRPSSGLDIHNLDMTGSEFNLGNTSDTYDFNETFAQYNTIKHQFEFNFSGSTGNGAVGLVDIPRVLVPGDYWYIEKVILDSTNLTTSGTASLSLGIQDTDSDCGVDHALVSDLNNRVRVFDLSNGLANGAKSYSHAIDQISMNVHTANITGGNIKVEVTLKNTNYYNSNE